MLKIPGENSKLKGAYLWVSLTAEALSLDTARFTTTFWKALEKESLGQGVKGHKGHSQSTDSIFNWGQVA